VECRGLTGAPPANCVILDESQQVQPSQIYFQRQQPSNPAALAYTSDQVFVADTGNHCIRLLDLARETVVTVAGVCGTEGFRDGPLGLNLLKNPTSLGMDEGGNIWIYDRGNSYIRMLRLNSSQQGWQEKGMLVTMIKGVCNSMPQQLAPQYPSSISRFSICYANWIKKSGEPLSHIFDESLLEYYCTKHFTECPEFQGVHPLFVGVQIYNKTVGKS